jgi:proline iminopeptidase
MRYNMDMSEEVLEDIKDKNIIRSGHLDVGDGHEIYWVDWGNGDIKEPIFYLHGGPGGGFGDKDFLNFDPKKHRVVFHDQRGSSRSTPFASTENNTTKDLISDIDKLKKELGFRKVSLYGFSWGSTLALLYAIANPDQVKKMLIGGIYLGRTADREFYLNGKVSTHFPEAWERFAANAPDTDDKNVSDYFKEKMLQNPNTDEKKKFAREWMIFESSLLKLDYVPESVERELKDFASESLAYLEAHYILNNSFIDENYILDNIDKIKEIPTIIVHGRYDFICMPSGAYELKNAMGDDTILHFVTSGHSRGDTVQREVVKAYLNYF